ncbi:MAG: antitoxin [Candidatus Caldatribacteriota bacterium]|nr:antitoxin [Candidatus Caldatribacteriota bacterium]
MDSKKYSVRNRLSIDIDPEEHQRIKVFAVLQGKSIREYVLESIRERLDRESEEKQLLAITTQINPVLKEVWNNKKDDIYSEI